MKPYPCLFCLMSFIILCSIRVVRSQDDACASIDLQLHRQFAKFNTTSLPCVPIYPVPLHIDYASGEFEVIQNIGHDYTSTGKVKGLVHLRRAHGCLNIIGWSVFLIIGALIARHYKHWDPIWFYAHAYILTLGVVCGFIGISCGLILSKKLPSSNAIKAHKNLGILVLFFGFLQVLAFKLRPEKESNIRKYWNYYHHNVGRLMVILAFSNTFYGLHLGGEGSSWFAGYGITVAILIAVAIVLEIRMRKMKSKTEPMLMYITL